MKVLFGKVPHQDEQNQKTFWRDAGYTLFVGDDNKVSMIDNRSGARILFFEREQNQEQRPAQSQAAQKKPSNNFYDDPMDF